MSEKENQLQQLLNDILEDKNANLTPDNLRKGVTLLGVTGNLSSGIDTSDATAVASDILAPKSAYINGQKVTGTIECSYKSVSNSTEMNVLDTTTGWLDYRPDLGVPPPWPRTNASSALLRQYSS